MILLVQIPFLNSTSQYGRDMSFSEINKKLREAFAAPGRVAQTVGHLTRKSGVLGSIPGLATYFRFSFRFFKQLVGRLVDLGLTAL